MECFEFDWGMMKFPEIKGEELEAMKVELCKAYKIM